VRRSDFGRFVAETLEANRRAANGSSIHHVRERAIDAELHRKGVTVVTDAGRRIDASLAVLATGNGAMRLPWPLGGELAGHPALIADPLGDMSRVRAIAPGARVLVVGAALTALDILSTLVRSRHAGPISVLSRHGLRPRPQRPPNPDSSNVRLLERIDGPVPAFMSEAPRTARGLTRALRTRIREAGDWYGPFDEMRDSLWKLWPSLDAREKRRFLRWMRPFYDAHRFRTPPQNDAIVREAEARGAIVFERGRLAGARAEGPAIAVEWSGPGGSRALGTFDAVINCTGLDASCGAHDNALLASLLAHGAIRRDPTGVGFEVDAQGRPLDRDGQPQPRLRMVGPPTAGTFGDPLGVLFIAPQVRRVVGAMLAGLDVAPRAGATQGVPVRSSD
jgi:uncharacterized NAD(P)/FAD-binding protein YdhS